MAHNLASQSIIDYIELSPDYSILEITAIPAWYGKTLETLKLRNKFGINVMAIKRYDSIIVSPEPEEKVNIGDVLVVLGNTNDISRLESKAGE